MDIPIYYDPMIAKLVVHGINRMDAIEKMKKAIADYKIVGVKTTLPFGTFVMNHAAFTTGNFDTKFVENYFHPNEKNETEVILATILASKLFSENEKAFSFIEQGNLDEKSNWSLNRAE